MKRRGFLGLLAGAVAAPAVLRFGEGAGDHEVHVAAQDAFRRAGLERDFRSHFQELFEERMPYLEDVLAEEYTQEILGLERRSRPWGS